MRCEENRVAKQREIVEKITQCARDAFELYKVFNKLQTPEIKELFEKEITPKLQEIYDKFEEEL